MAGTCWTCWTCMCYSRNLRRHSTQIDQRMSISNLQFIKSTQKCHFTDDQLHSPSDYAVNYNEILDHSNGLPNTDSIYYDAAYNKQHLPAICWKSESNVVFKEVEQFIDDNFPKAGLVLRLQGGSIVPMEYHFKRITNTGHGTPIRNYNETFDEFQLTYEANVNLTPFLKHKPTCFTATNNEAEIIQQFINHRGIGKRLKIVTKMNDNHDLVCKLFEELSLQLLNDLKLSNDASSIFNVSHTMTKIIEPWSVSYIDVGNSKSQRGGEEGLCLCDDMTPRGIFNCCICLVGFCGECVCGKSFIDSCLDGCIAAFCGAYKEFTITRLVPNTWNVEDVPDFIGSLKPSIKMYIEKEGQYPYDIQQDTYRDNPLRDPIAAV